MSTGPKPNMPTIDDATCTFCGCLCDDIVLLVEGGLITTAKNACSLGEQWFLGQGDEPGPACLIDGHPAPFDDGIERAARILHEARYPLVFGFCETTSAAQRAALSLADWAGACVDAAPDSNRGATTLAMQEVGQVTCTLGEVKHRGDLIIFWGCNPAETHPRHLSRYSLEPEGEFVPRGRRDRYCIVVDTRETATAQLADQFIAIRPGKDFEAIWTLRALAKDVELDAAIVEAETGVSLATWRDLMNRMKRAGYGVFFSSAANETPFDTHQCGYAILALVREMNAHARFVCLSMGSPGNGAGAETVSTWQTGYPFAISLARGFPRFGPRDFTAGDVLERAECDAALVVAGDPLAGLTPAAREHLTRIPTVVLHSRDTAVAGLAQVALRTATYGIHTPGTVYRVDGVPIPLRPALPSPLASAEDILLRIERGLRELQGAGSR